MILLTEKILPPENSPSYGSLSKMVRAINSDRFAAFVFQAAEIFIEVYAFAAILYSSLVGLGVSQNFTWGLSVCLGSLCSVAMQGQYTSNITMEVMVKNDNSLQGITTAEQYRNTAVLIAVLLLFINTYGAYSYFHPNIETTKQLETTAYEQHKMSMEQATTSYNNQKAATLDYNAQILAINTRYDEKLKDEPNKARSIEKSRKNELKPVLNDKIRMMADADSIFRIDKVAADSTLKSELAIIRANNAAAYDSQWWAEIGFLASSFVVSLFLLGFVWLFHRRSAQLEIKCGVQYKVIIPKSNYSAFAVWRFVIGNFLNALLLSGAQKVHKFNQDKKKDFDFNEGSTPTPVVRKVRRKIIIDKSKFQQEPIDYQEDKIEQTPPPQDDETADLSLDNETTDHETPENAPTDEEIAQDATNTLGMIDWIDGDGNPTQYSRREAQNRLAKYLERSINNESPESRAEQKANFEGLKANCNKAGYEVNFSVSDKAMPKIFRRGAKTYERSWIETRVEVIAPQAEGGTL